MSIEARLSQLEESLAREHEESPQSVPEQWCEFGDDGQTVGPPAGAYVTAGQCVTMATVMAMDATIPAADD